MPKGRDTCVFYVDDKFRWMMKKKAVEHRVNVVELTRRIAENDAFDQYFKVHNEKKKSKRTFF